MPRRRRPTARRRSPGSTWTWRARAIGRPRHVPTSWPEKQLERAGQARARPPRSPRSTGSQARRAARPPRGPVRGRPARRRAASAAASRPPGVSRSAAHIAATSASRCVSRARRTSSGSRRLAALEQQRSRVAAALLLERDLPAQVLHLAPPSRRPAARPRPRPAARAPRRARRRRASPWRPRAGAAPRRPGSGVSSPRARGTRPPQPGRRAPAPGRPSARAPRRRPRRARRAAWARCQARRSGSISRIGGLRQRAVHVLPLLRRRRRGRPPSAPADGETARARRTRAGRPRRGARAASRRSRAARPPATRAADRRPDRPPRAAAAPGVGGSASSRRRKLSSMPLGERAAPASPNPPASSAGVNPRGSSSSASGLPRVSATIWSRTRASSGAGQRPSPAARAHRASRSPSTTSSGSPASSSLGVARGEDQADRLRRQAARHEREDLRRGAVEPLLVVDHAEQRLLLGHLGQQAQHGQPDEEAIRRAARRPRPNAVRSASRCGTGRPLEAIQHRRAQLMQRRRTRAPSPTARRRRAPPGNSGACSARYSSSAVLPTPGSPRTTSARLSPAPTASISRSSTSHSLRRPVSDGRAAAELGKGWPSRW